jgi:hypothetical protein
MSSKKELADLERELCFGYTRERLTDAFELIKSTTHWKDPIHAVIREDMIDICGAACRFFAATELKIVGKSRVPGFIVVRSKGYRAGPAGDH